MNEKMLIKCFIHDIKNINELTYATSIHLLVTSLAYIHCTVSCDCSIRCFVNDIIDITTKQKQKAIIIIITCNITE